MTKRYTVIFAKRAGRAFDRLAHSDRSLGRRLAAAIECIASDPESGELLTGDWKGYRKYRVGDYRIIYRIEREVLIVYVVAVGHRSEIYR